MDLKMGRLFLIIWPIKWKREAAERVKEAR